LQTYFITILIKPTKSICDLPLCKYTNLYKTIG
jgi:hypothetical protein